MDYGEMMAHAAGEGFDSVEDWNNSRRKTRNMDDMFYDDSDDDMEDSRNE